MNCARRVMIATGVVLLSAAAAWSQPVKKVDQTPPAKEPAPSVEPAKPAPAPAPAAPTLVQRNAEGRVIRLSELPPVAAVRIMSLSADSRRQADRIIADKSAELDKFARANFGAVVRLYEAHADGRAAEAARLASDMWDRNKELRDRSSVTQELMAFMSPTESAELRRLVQEYLQARIADEASAAKVRFDRFDPKEFIRSEQVYMLGEDLVRAFGRIAEKASLDADELSKSLGLSPKQDEEVRRLAADAYQRALGDMTASQRAELLRQVIHVLHEEQRTVMFARLSGQPGGTETAGR